MAIIKKANNRKTLTSKLWGELCVVGCLVAEFIAVDLVLSPLNKLTVLEIKASKCVSFS